MSDEQKSEVEDAGPVWTEMETKWEDLGGGFYNNTWVVGDIEYVEGFAEGMGLPRLISIRNLKTGKVNAGKDAFVYDPESGRMQHNIPN